MKEPIHHFYSKYPFDPSGIEKIVSGDCFTAVMLKNGKIGLCSNTSYTIEPENIDLNKINSNIIEHRIILNAYFNAILNYERAYTVEKDVFDFVDFKKYSNIVMIGFFESTYAKFTNSGLKVSVFDIDKADPALIPIQKEMDFVRNADAIMMTSTTVANNSFSDIVNNTKSGCDIFLTGPSSIMHPDMFGYKNVKAILGSVFNDHDQQVMDLIKGGACTRDFIRLGKKVVYQK